MDKVFKILANIKNEVSQTIADGFPVASLPGVRNHKIGLSDLGFPMFFIKCDDGDKTSIVDLNLEFISIHYSRECLLVTSKMRKKKGVYTIISLKTDRPDLQEYFTEVVFLLVKRLPEMPTLKQFRLEIEKIISLFSKFSKPPIKTIQGLWAELLIIEQCRNPEYLIRAWHSSPIDKYDFNDGVDKIEVKSTSTMKRKHRFSIEQLSPNPNSNLIIASVITIESGIGKNISQLVNSIEKSLNDSDLLFIVNDTIANTLGKDFEKTFDVFYDYQLAVDSINIYCWKDIPAIPSKCIPQELSNISFDCDLTNTPILKNPNTESKLHHALLKLKS